MIVRNEYSIQINNAIVEIVYHKKTILNLETVKKLVADRLSLSNGTSYPIFVTAEDDKKMVGREVREYAAGEEALKNVSAVAILVRSFWGKFISNFFIRVNVINSKIPIRLVSTKEEAIDWFKEIKVLV